MIKVSFSLFRAGLVLIFLLSLGIGSFVASVFFAHVPAVSSSLREETESLSYALQHLPPPRKPVKQAGTIPSLETLKQTMEAQSVVIQSGQTLAGVLEKTFGLSPVEGANVVVALKKVMNPRVIRTGEMIWAFFQKGELQVLEMSRQGLYRIGVRASNGWVPYKEKISVWPTLLVSGGRIESSFYVAAKLSGLEEGQIRQMMEVLRGSLDFEREIQAGDYFTVIFEHLLDENDKDIGVKTLLAIAFSRKNTSLFYAAFFNKNGSIEYFDTTGVSASSFLLKTPVRYKRISSPYGMRKHPISGYNKMHAGVDFAAQAGSHVLAAGKGKIVFARENGRYGNFLMIKHANGYQTAYAHLKGFARGIVQGRRVEKGQLIGYVGNTGSSTGVHLHYEVRLNGVHLNPMALKLPKERDLSEEEQQYFETYVFSLQKIISGYYFSEEQQLKILERMKKHKEPSS